MKTINTTLCILRTGSGGLVAAVTAAQFGMDVVLIQENISLSKVAAIIIPYPTREEFNKATASDTAKRY
jgi:UDP-glucose 6-dehydrogenase